MLNIKLIYNKMYAMDIVVFPVALMATFVFGLAAGLRNSACRECDELADQNDELVRENQKLVNTIAHLKEHIVWQSASLLNYEHDKTD